MDESASFYDDSDDSESGEEDSLQQQEDSEVVSETESESESPNTTREVQKKHSPRDSDVFFCKRGPKKVRVFDSDTSDDETGQQEQVPQPQHKQLFNTDTDSDDVPDSGENPGVDDQTEQQAPQPQYKRLLTTDRDPDDVPDSDDIQDSDADPDSDDCSEHQIEHSTSASISGGSTKVIGQENTRQSISSESDDGAPFENEASKDDNTNSKAVNDLRNADNSFRFSNIGILHSTGVPEATSDSVEIVSSSSSSDIVEVSSGEELDSPNRDAVKPIRRPLSVKKQQTLHRFITVQSNSEAPPPVKVEPKEESGATAQQTRESPILEKIVSRNEYWAQQARAESAEQDFAKLQAMAAKLDFAALPDGGQLIKDRLKIARNKLKSEVQKLNMMVVSEEEAKEHVEQAAAPTDADADAINWDDIQAGANAVLPKTFGKRALSTYNAQKAVTMDRLQQLHGALLTCPKEEDQAEDPKGLKVELMPHQKRALLWLMFREKSKPSGGILADDMGLGKTLTMISLILSEKQFKEHNDSEEENRERNAEWLRKQHKVKGGSLIVCPASLINQWSGEIDKRLRRGLLSYRVYHGNKRECRTNELAEYDVVITTYSIVAIEREKNSALFRVHWRRVILDEAHQIRNYKTQSSEACCGLSAQSRWALTGTPMHNKLEDLYALLKFLRCTPFDELVVWKRWIGDKSSGGQERLHTVISSLMLRRTKSELIEKKFLTSMPEKQWRQVDVTLDASEMKVYHKVLIFSQSLFAQFLHQRAVKNQDYSDQKLTAMPNNSPNEEYLKVRKELLKLNKVQNVSQHEILVLLLRLRQICCHPSLITAMLEEGLEEIGEDREELNILEQLEKLNINDDASKDDTENEWGLGNEGVNLKEAVRGHLRPSDPVFAKDRASSKIKEMLKLLNEVISKGDKAIIVSQWSSYLDLVGIHLKGHGVKFDQLDGKVPVLKRMDIINKINNPNDPTKVLLLSLTAGGVGLNLVGANHLFLLDLHWNPQLERQAQDRIYRVGQTKPVFMYKLLAIDTIEERIKLIQDSKTSLAEAVLTGTKQVGQNKLSIDDLKLIFGFANPP